MNAYYVPGTAIIPTEETSMEKRPSWSSQSHSGKDGHPNRKKISTITGTKGQSLDREVQKKRKHDRIWKDAQESDKGIDEKGNFQAKTTKAQK